MAKSPKQVEQERMMRSKGAQHPANNPKNAEKLLQHIHERLQFACTGRDDLLQRFELIDKDFSGYVELDADDKKRDKDNKKGKAFKPVATNLQLMATQIDEEVTYMINVFCPDGTFFKALSSKNKQQAANALAARMSNDANAKGYLREYSKAITSMFKYNLGGFCTYWQSVKGNRISAAPDTGAAVIKNEEVWAGNCIHSIDVYNFLWDLSVNVVDLPELGEFFAIPEIKTNFGLRKMERDGMIYGTHRFIADGDKSGFVDLQHVTGTEQELYFKMHPNLRGTTQVAGGSGSMDWRPLMSQGNWKSVGTGVEIVTYYGRLIPSDFGLSSSKELEVWRIRMANGRHICDDMHLTNAHDMLPVAIGMPTEDHLGLQQRSVAELLQPLQGFGSFLMNTHVAGTRKRIYGLTVYNPAMIDLKDKEISESMRIATKSMGKDDDIRKHIQHFTEGPDTADTMVDLDRVMALMNKILPTDLAKQVADLDRATTYHAAATIQAGNRRNLKLAKMIDSQCLTKLRTQLQLNLQQYGASFTIPVDGQEVTVSAQDLRTLMIEYDISDGLKAVDRLMMINFMKEIILALIQMPAGSTNLDVPGILNYWTSLMGDKFDLRQFQISQEQMVRNAMMQNPKLIEQMQQNGGIPNVSTTPASGTATPPPGGAAGAPAY